MVNCACVEFVSSLLLLLFLRIPLFSLKSEFRRFTVSSRKDSNYKTCESWNHRRLEATHFGQSCLSEVYIEPIISSSRELYTVVMLLIEAKIWTGDLSLLELFYLPK